MFVQNEFKSLVCDFLSFFHVFFCEITIVSIGLTIEFNFQLYKKKEKEEGETKALTIIVFVK